MMKLFVFSIFGSGDKQEWDSYDGHAENPSAVRFILPDDESDLDFDSNSSTDSELLLQ